MTPTFLTCINGCTLQPLPEFRGDFVTHEMHTSRQLFRYGGRRGVWSEDLSMGVVCFWAAAPAQEETAQGSSSKLLRRTPRGYANFLGVGRWGRLSHSDWGLLLPFTGGDPGCQTLCKMQCSSQRRNVSCPTRHGG